MNIFTSTDYEWPFPDEFECPQLDDLDDELANYLKVTAVDLLWNWTGKRFGLKIQTVLPGKSACIGNEIRLPGRVHNIVEVYINDEPIDKENLHVENHSLLVRKNKWPKRGVEVTYVRGREVPIGGRLAAAQLACELSKGYVGDSSCQLPKRIQSLVREGITIGFVDEFEGLEDGRTGIWQVDAWVSSVREEVIKPRVFSPDVARSRTVTWTG